MTLESIARAVAELRSRDILYCHWKGNSSLARVLAGEKDFELLVDRKASNEAVVVLLNAGFKRAVTRPVDALPGVSHYYGLDWKTGQLAHVHFYTRLVTGESFVASHLLPFERMLLGNVDHIGEVRVPSRQAEFVCHTVRTLIKYGSPVDLVFSFRKLKDDEAALGWLKADNNVSEAVRLLKEHCPLMGEDLFIKSICTLDTRASLVEKLALGRQVRRRLRVYERQTGFIRFVAFCGLLWGHAWRRLRGRQKGKMLETGGAVIAFVGADATGKSTLVSECSKWLGSAFAVRTLHAGKPPSTWLTAPINLILLLTRGLRSQPGATSDVGVESNHPALSHSTGKDVASLIYALRAVSLAWDRRKLLLRARRAAANGEIVICDRYPSEVIGTMDSPRLYEDSTQRGLTAALYNWLARVEQRFYREIPPPDVVLKLRVSIETAKRRNSERTKRDRDADPYLESRHRQCQLWLRAGATNVHEVETEQPLAQTILNVKRLIWESL